MSKTKAHAKAERRNRIISFNHFPENVFEFSARFDLLKSPLFQSHKTRLTRLVPPCSPEPEINLPITPKFLRAPWKLEIDWNWRNRLRVPVILQSPPPNGYRV